MSIDLSNRTQINELDQSNVLASIEQLPDQMEDAWENTANLPYQEYAKGVDHVIVAGMGGSALGAEVIKSVAKKYLKVPLEIVKDYSLPEYVNHNTLVIASSYSGTTEESIQAAAEAKAKGARLSVIAAGGDLEKLADQNNYPKYIIDPKYNPSNQPRMAIGYTITGQIGLLKSFGLLDSSDFSINETVDFLRAQSPQLGPEGENSKAKQLASKGLEKILYLISAEHLTGATHVMNNQFNENAKHLTVELQLPELNHHYMEGLPHPKVAHDNCIFWLFQSSLYSQKLQLRTRLTEDVINKVGYASEIITLSAPTRFTQVFELIQLGAYTNFYMAMLHGINPAPIPWVDYFKDQLKLQSQ